MAVALVQPVPVAKQAEQADTERGQRPVDGADTGQHNAQGEHGFDAMPPQLGHAAIVARPRYAWRCRRCRRILMRHDMPLSTIAALVGRIEIKCHCNEPNGVE